MITISLCMIVKNEEPVLARCLDSVASMMDEIIIVDTGSTDRTKETAAQEQNESVNAYIKKAIQSRYTADTGDNIEL